MPYTATWWWISTTNARVSKPFRCLLDDRERIAYTCVTIYDSPSSSPLPYSVTPGHPTPSIISHCILPSTSMAYSQGQMYGGPQQAAFGGAQASANAWAQYPYPQAAYGAAAQVYGSRSLVWGKC